MKLALVFDDLIQFGGAERLLLAVHELYPDAPVFTSLASDGWLRRCKDKNVQLKTSFMQKLPFKKQLNRFYGLLGLHILAFESFKFDDFDVVLSISARFAHAVVTKPGTTHICYMNSPGRMIWEPWDYFEREGFLQNRFVRKLFWIFASPFLTILRLWDYACAQRVDFFIANSKTPQVRIRKYYRRDSQIIYPFVDDLVGAGQGAVIPVTSDPADPPKAGRGFSEDGNAAPYFLVVTRLSPWKRVDIVIEACKAVGVNLKIIGEGSDKDRLIEIAVNDQATHNVTLAKSPVNPALQKSTIEFLGYVSDEEKSQVMQNCQALIVTQKEDFGITALEAMALGKPVLAFRAGGALETVIEEVTGDFFDPQTSQALAQTLSRFNPSNYKTQDCINRSLEFSKQKFLSQLDEFVKKVYHSTNCPR